MRILVAAIMAAALAMGSAWAASKPVCCEAVQKAPAGRVDKAGVYVWGVGSFEPKFAKVQRSLAGAVGGGGTVLFSLDHREKKSAVGELDNLLGRKAYPSTSEDIVLKPDEMLLAITHQRFEVKFAGEEKDNAKGEYDPKGGIDGYGDKVNLNHKAAIVNLRKKVRFSGRLGEDGTVTVDHIDPAGQHDAEVRHMFIRIVGKISVTKDEDGKAKIICKAGDQEVPLPAPNAPFKAVMRFDGSNVVADGTLVSSARGKSFHIQVVRRDGEKDEIPLPDDGDEVETLPKLKRKIDVDVDSGRRIFEQERIRGHADPDLRTRDRHGRRMPLNHPRSFAVGK